MQFLDVVKRQWQNVRSYLRLLRLGTPLPGGWGDDQLSKFLQMAHHNTIASSVNFQGSFRRLKDLDDLFNELRKKLDNTPHWFVVFFLLRAHATFLASARAALSGQLAETFICSRACLEAALYGYFLHKNPEHRKTWLSRHDSEESKQKCKNIFQTGPLKKVLREGNADIEKIFGLLYEDTIDMGGHPNERAFFSSARITEDSEAISIDLAFLTSDRTSLLVAMRMASQVAGCVLHVFKMIFPDEFQPINGKLRSVTEGL